jgi:hypothetical protein
MEWLIVGMIIIASIIYYLMRKLDCYLDQYRVQSELIPKKPSEKTYALILGETPIADHLKILLDSNKIDYLQIKDESYLDKTKSYHHLFALSGDDLSNMLVCIIINKIMDDCTMIAVCNQLPDRKLYEQNNIPYLLAEEINAEALFQCVYPA